MRLLIRPLRVALLLFATAGLTACGTTAPPAPDTLAAVSSGAPEYIIGPLDTLDVFVWRNPELSTTVPVRPDGRVTLPLVEDIAAAGKTPVELARDIESELDEYVLDPIVTVMVRGFSGPFDQQVRVVGEATEPRAIPYRSKMTVLDVMIEVGGLTEFADGNRAVLVRGEGEQQQTYTARLDDLLRDGDITASIPVLPGDVLISPESWF